MAEEYSHPTFTDTSTLILGLSAISNMWDKHKFLNCWDYYPEFKQHIAKTIELLILEDTITTQLTEKNLREFLKDLPLADLDEIILPLDITSIMKTDLSNKIVEFNEHPRAIRSTLIASMIGNHSINNLRSQSFNVFDFVEVYERSTYKEEYWLSYMTSKDKYGLNYAFINYKNTESLISSYLGSKYSSKYIEKNLGLIKDSVLTEINEKNDWLGETFFSLDVPLLFNHVVQKATSYKDIIKIVLEIRNSKEVQAFRKNNRIFEKALRTGDKKAIYEMILDVENSMKIINKKVSSPAVRIDISFPLAATINLAEAKEFLDFRAKRHLVFLSKLYESAIISQDTMGKFLRLLYLD